ESSSFRSTIDFASKGAQQIRLDSNYKSFAPNGVSKISLQRIASLQIRRIVVRAPTWVGDAVMSIPALRELRRLLPDAHISIVARPGTADIFIDADFIDQVIISQPGFFASIRQLREGEFDLAVLF